MFLKLIKNIEIKYKVLKLKTKTFNNIYKNG